LQRRAAQSPNVRQCGLRRGKAKVLGNRAELPVPYGTTCSSRESILQQAVKDSIFQLGRRPTQRCYLHVDGPAARQLCIAEQHAQTEGKVPTPEQLQSMEDAYSSCRVSALVAVFDAVPDNDDIITGGCSDEEVTEAAAAATSIDQGSLCRGSGISISWFYGAGTAYKLKNIPDGEKARRGILVINTILMTTVLVSLSKRCLPESFAMGTSYEEAKW